MSYTVLSGGIPDFTQSVISLWFRVPKSSLIACAQAAAAIPFYDPLYPPHLYGIIPLVTFGVPLTKPVLVQEKQTWDYWMQYDTFIQGPAPVPCPVISYRPVSGGDAYIDPSYIGVSVLQNQVTVVGNFQTTAIPTIGGEFVVDGCTLHYGPPPPGGNPTYDGATTTWVEYAPPQGPQSYYFWVFRDSDSFADKWHHLLVSCDLSSSVSAHPSDDTIAEGVDSYNRMWVALDDVNVNGIDAFPNFVSGGDDPNAVITDAAYHAAAFGMPTDGYPLPLTEIEATPVTMSNGITYIISGPLADQNVGESNTSNVPRTCAVPPAPVPASPLGLPATADQVDHVFHVEMAEFQMWTGVTLDTSIEKNRRAFIARISSKNENGELIQIEQPVPPSTAESLLGKKPDILLHGSENWILGTNTGSAGKKFQSTGKIKAYLPDPNLGGKQGDPQ